jgi:hypothetical protein
LAVPVTESANNSSMLNRVLQPYQGVVAPFAMDVREVRGKDGAFFITVIGSAGEKIFKSRKTFRSVALSRDARKVAQSASLC